MHRLNELLHTLTAASSAAQKVDAIFDRMSIVEAAIPTPDISRERAEYALHRLMTDMLATKRSSGLLH